MNPINARPLAVITGASSGIGFELARVFAEHDFDLLINAEDSGLEDAKRVLEGQAAVEAVRADLSKPKGVEKLYERIRKTGRPVDSLAVNAGIGEAGDFARHSDLSQELKVVDLNVRSTVHLTKLVLRDMVGRGDGRVLFTSAIESSMPSAYQAVYGASKAFVDSFALALRDEVNDTGVTITSLVPGPTETRFFERAHMQDARIASIEKDDPAEVARQAFEGLMKGKEKVVTGSLANKLVAYGGRFVPDRARAEVHRLLAEPRSTRG